MAPGPVTPVFERGGKMGNFPPFTRDPVPAVSPSCSGSWNSHPLCLSLSIAPLLSRWHPVWHRQKATATPCFCDLQM